MWESAPENAENSGIRNDKFTCAIPKNVCACVSECVVKDARFLSYLDPGMCVGSVSGKRKENHQSTDFYSPTETATNDRLPPPQHRDEKTKCSSKID